MCGPFLQMFLCLCKLDFDLQFEHIYEEPSFHVVLYIMIFSVNSLSKTHITTRNMKYVPLQYDESCSSIELIIVEHSIRPERHEYRLLFELN